MLLHLHWTILVIFQLNVIKSFSVHQCNIARGLGFGKQTDIEINGNVSEILQLYGYSSEEHTVITDDGYMLTLFRIVSKTRRMSAKSKVVVLQHGLLDSAHTWINNAPNQSLGYILADAGHDVWLTNSRGNTYGMRHRFLSSDELEFWNFSWDHMARYDLPATLLYILQHTGSQKLTYIGHSQGTQIAFAYFSGNEELRANVSLLIGLAPVAFVGDLESPIRYVARFSQTLEQVTEWFGTGEFLPSNDLVHFLAKFLCAKGHVPFICSNILYLLAGYDVTNTNKTRLPIYVSHTPAGTSVQNMVHHCQGVTSKRFQMYDFGKQQNIMEYGQAEPPRYELAKLNLPIGLYYGGEDWLSDRKDVNRLIAWIQPNLVRSKLLPKYNHLDFVWGMNAAEVLYPDVLELISNF